MNGKIALVTGASGGIGAACARRLSADGWTVLAHGFRGEAALHALCEELNAAGGDAHPLRCDLADAGDTARMCREVLTLWHRVDALVLCAGVAWTGLLCDMQEADWQRVMDVNLTSAYRLCRALTPGMVRNGHGAVVAVSSMWGRSGASCEAAYAASKAGMIGLIRSLSKELGPSGVRANCVAPGVIDTRMMDEHTAETRAMLAEETPLGRLGTPDEVAAAVRFLVSGEAAFITGQVLGVDGGYL